MIGLLNAYHREEGLMEFQKRYAGMASGYLENLLGKSVKVYSLARGERPQDPSECELWVISGSPHSCKDRAGWILELIDFVKLCHVKKQKLLGLCFGHQLIAHSLGGKVDTSKKGWGVGTRSWQITKKHSWMDEGSRTTELLYSHQEQVLELPPRAEAQGKSDFCEYEAYSVEKHILCFQGHPEFDKAFAGEIYRNRKESLGETLVKKALLSLDKSVNQDLVNRWIQDFSKINR